MRYTPGPWKICADDDEDIDSEYYIEVRSRLSGHLCQLGSGTFSKDDAQLISAAPELYEACGRLIGSLGVMITDPDNDPDIQFARAAIAKAEGNGTA